MGRKKMIQEYETSLKGAIGSLKKEIDGLEQWISNEAYYGDEFLENPTAAGLSSFLGKMEKSSDIMNRISAVTSKIEGCPLNSVDFYKTTSPILRGIAKEMVGRCKHYDKQVSDAKMSKTKRQRRVKAYFAKVYKNIIKEVFIDAMQDSYTKRRGDTKKTICGEPCEDGHPCQHTVWEGWICWQHGGGRKDTGE